MNQRSEQKTKIRIVKKNLKNKIEVWIIFQSDFYRMEYDQLDALFFMLFPKSLGKIYRIIMKQIQQNVRKQTWNCLWTMTTVYYKKIF